MRADKISKIEAVLAIAGYALLAASCAGETAAFRPDSIAAAPRSQTKTIAPRYAALSDPAITTDKSAKEYYLDLEQCREDVSVAMGEAKSDDVAALRRALQNQSGTSNVVVHYQSTDRGIIRDRAVKACLAKRGYVVKL